jgi:hypothetical protein
MKLKTYLERMKRGGAVLRQTQASLGYTRNPVNWAENLAGLPMTDDEVLAHRSYNSFMRGMHGFTRAAL